MLWFRAEEWAARADQLKADGWRAIDLCGVDRLGVADAGERFEVVVQLLHMGRKERACVHVAATGDPPTVPSTAKVWPAVNFMEREAYDLVGIHFDGHPNLSRILMPDAWEGHPLRKDYGVGKVPVEFVPQPFLQIDAPGQAATSEGAGRNVDRLGQPVAGEDAVSRPDGSMSPSGAIVPNGDES
ncbi:MAG TPA: NADH-quinone oxidoreductase subunit C [Actinomycetota bacterium]|nr:NADH-quinone oxidoreductase subunit C [Actinomycetota bacterium]